MVTFGERIRAMASAMGRHEQDVAKDLGLTKSQMSHYISGRSKVPSELLQRIVDMYKINPLFLFRENVPLYEVKEKDHLRDYNYLPTAISAGLPIEVDGITEVDQISIPDALMGKYAGQTDIYITRINGESMNKVMQDGSLIAVKPVELHELKENDIVVYSHNHDYGVKRFFKNNNEIWFRPHSTDFRFKDDIYNEDNL